MALVLFHQQNNQSLTKKPFTMGNKNKTTDITQIEKYLRFLSGTEGMEGTDWVNGLGFFDPLVCTSTAIAMAERFNGRVFGYYIELSDDNRLVGYKSGGHDFCIIGDSIIVDWWAKMVEDEGNVWIIDLNTPDGAEYFRNKYLPRDKWEEVIFK